jgi:hypothetical protein
MCIEGPAGSSMLDSAVSGGGTKQRVRRTVAEGRVVAVCSCEHFGIMAALHGEHIAH